MKNPFIRILIPFAAAVYILAASVSTDYNHSADFAKYHTYSWLKVQASDALWEDRIKHAVDSELSAKGMGEATTTTENTPVGTLNVDVFDSQTKQLLWRGKSSETLSGKSDKNEKKLEKDVTDMFKKFPPPTKG